MAQPSREHTLGIDEGTTGVRALVLSGSGAIVGSAYLEIDQRFPRPGWVETDPLELWRATQEVAQRALRQARLGPGDVAAIGVTNQRGSAVLYRRDGVPLGQILGWQDTRTTDRAIELLGKGLFILPMTAATKYEWLLREVGGTTPRSDLRCGTIDTWLASCLTGHSSHVSDHSNLSISGLYDLEQGRYNEHALTELGLEPGLLPAIVDTSGMVGETTIEAFGARVPVASLSGDQHAAMYAQACHAIGAVKLSLGTSGMMDMNAGESLDAPPGAYPIVLWSLDGHRSFCFEGATITAGAAAQWLRDGIGIVSDLADIESLARSVPSSDGVWVVPAFQGLGTPHLNLIARAMIGGLARGSTRAHIARAVLEGVAWRCAEVFEALTAKLPSLPEVVRVDGGAARNSLLLEMIADAIGVPIERPAELDSAAIGAAQLAARAVGLLRDDQVAARWSLDRRFEPSMSADERGTRRERWRHLIRLVTEAGA